MSRSRGRAAVLIIIIIIIMLRSYVRRHVPRRGGKGRDDHTRVLRALQCGRVVIVFVVIRVRRVRVRRRASCSSLVTGGADGVRVKTVVSVGVVTDGGTVATRQRRRVEATAAAGLGGGIRREVVIARLVIIVHVIVVIAAAGRVVDIAVRLVVALIAQVNIIGVLPVAVGVQ